MICFCERKLKIILSCISLLIYASFLVIVPWFFHIRRFLPFLSIVTWHFHIRILLLFFGRFSGKSKSILFFRFVCPENDATIRNQLYRYKWFPAFKLLKKQPLYSAKIYEKIIVSKEYCIASHDDKMCFLPKCRYHIILIRNIEELLQKLDAFCFKYQYFACLYAPFKYRFIDKIVVKRRVDKFLLMCGGQFISTSKTEEWTERPWSSKNESWGRKYK